MRGRVVLLLMSVAVLGFAPAPFPKKERRADPSELTGTWEFVLWESSGRRAENNEVAYRIEITREEFVIVATTRKYREDYQLRLDPSSSPASFTATRPGTTLMGCYRWQGNQLAIIFNSGGGTPARATDFNGTPGWRFILRRVKGD